jgi:hypothetical protein
MRPGRLAVGLVAVALSLPIAADAGSWAAGPNPITQGDAIRVGAAPLALVATRTSLWVLAETDVDVRVLRLDLRTGARRASFHVATVVPDLGALAFGNGHVWAAAGNQLLRIDPADPATVARARLPGIASSVAVGLGSVWITTVGVNRRSLLVRLDARSLAVTARIWVEGGPALAVGRGSVWAAGNPALLRVDPRANRVAARLFPSSPPATDLMFAGNRLWVLGGPLVTELTVRNTAAARIHLPTAGIRFAVAQRRAWVIDNCGCRRGTLIALDLSTHRVVAQLPTGETPVAVAAQRSDLWVANFADGTLSHFRIS